MTLPVKVIIPWRPEPSRLDGFEWLLRYYTHRFGADAVHVETDDSDKPFNKSRTINTAVSRFPGHVCVITDADVFICDWTLRKAIQLAELNDFLYLPHNSTCRMTQSQSRRLLADDPDKRFSGKMHRKQRTAACPGGLWVVRSDFFLQYKMDERFFGWGGEDTELMRRIPHVRLAGPLFHIWHRKASMQRLRANKRLLCETKIGLIHYRGIPAQQHPSTQAALAELMEQNPPSQIVEIGTAHGGLTWMLRDLAPTAAIRTYDIKPCPNIGLLTSLGIDCRVADPLAAESQQELVGFIQRPGTTMIFCDGGNKPCEVNAIAEIAKPGDLILAHDYAPSREIFASEIRGKRWNWCEITDADLPESRVLVIESPALRDAMWYSGERLCVSEMKMLSVRTSN